MKTGKNIMYHMYLNLIENRLTKPNTNTQDEESCKKKKKGKHKSTAVTSQLTSKLYLFLLLVLSEPRGFPAAKGA